MVEQDPPQSSRPATLEEVISCPSPLASSIKDAEKEIEIREIQGVRIPFASAELMLRLKQGVREKDVLDLKFLEALLAGRGAGFLTVGDALVRTHASRPLEVASLLRRPSDGFSFLYCQAWPESHS